MLKQYYKRGLIMKNKPKILMVIFSIVLFVLVACGNSTDKLNAKQNNQLSNTNSTRNADGNKDASLENSTSEDAGDTKKNDQENTSNSTSANSNDGESLKSSNSDAEITKSKKDEYLKKLNEMEELDKNEEVKTTMVEMVEQQAERGKTWDKELNEIYGVLKEQLSTEEMDKLREEQRNWIKRRDEITKEVSLKYEGGTMESLEFLATIASLTRERCYELVVNYMK